MAGLGVTIKRHVSVQSIYIICAVKLDYFKQGLLWRIS